MTDVALPSITIADIGDVEPLIRKSAQSGLAFSEGDHRSRLDRVRVHQVVGPVVRLLLGFIGQRPPSVAFLGRFGLFRVFRPFAFGVTVGVFGFLSQASFTGLLAVLGTILGVMMIAFMSPCQHLGPVFRVGLVATRL